LSNESGQNPEPWVWRVATIELFERDEGSGTEAVIDSDDRLDTARSLYSRAVMNHPSRLVMLCDRARVLARSDHPETMPI
jgi:hypothetical protein